MSGAATSSSGGNPFKNILLGVLTTVIATFIVYKLGVHNPNKEEYEKHKKATTEAWHDLLTYENSFKNTAIRLVCVGDTSNMTTEILREYGNIIDDIANLKKVENVDDLLFSLINRRLGTLQDKKDATADYYKKLEDISNSLLSEDEKTNQTIQLENNFMKRVNDLDNRDTSVMNERQVELKKKYHADFSFLPAFGVSPQILIGDWTMDRESDLQLKKDYGFSWKKDTDEYKGTWSLIGLQLQFDFTDGSRAEYTITNAAETVMLMKLTSNQSVHFICRK